MSKKQGKSGQPKLPHGWHVITNKEAADIVRHASTGKIEIRPTGEKWPKFDFVVVGLKSACCKADVYAQCISIDYPDGFFWTCSSCGKAVDEKGNREVPFSIPDFGIEDIDIKDNGVPF